MNFLLLAKTASSHNVALLLRKCLRKDATDPRNTVFIARTSLCRGPDAKFKCMAVHMPPSTQPIQQVVADGMTHNPAKKEDESKRYTRITIKRSQKATEMHIREKLVLV